MSQSPLTMTQVAVELERIERNKACVARQEALHERVNDLLDELDRIEPYAQLLELPATAYLLRSIGQPGNIKLLRREMFPNNMNSSAEYQANGPVVQTLWACAGLDPNLPAPTVRQLQGPFDLQDRLACALLAIQVVEMAQDLRYRLDSTKSAALSHPQLENVLLSAFNAPDAWINRFHGLRHAARMQVDGNFHEKETLSRFMNEVDNAVRVSISWNRVCQQVPAKLEQINTQLAQCQARLEPLPQQSTQMVALRRGGPGQKAPWMKVQERPAAPVVQGAPHGTSVPPQELASLVAQQRTLQRLTERRLALSEELVGARSFAAFVQRPAVVLVLESLQDLDLTRQLFVEFDPLSFAGQVEYQMQSPTTQQSSGVALGMFSKVLAQMDPRLGLWDPARPDQDSPGLINCMCGSALALHCAQLYELLLRRTHSLPADQSHFSEQQLRSLVLSGFEHPSLWEQAFSQLCWIVDSRAPLSLAKLPLDIQLQADRQLEIPHLSALSSARAAVLVAELAQVDEALVQVREKISHSIAAFESPNVHHETIRDLEGAAGGRLLMQRLLAALGPSAAEALPLESRG